MKTAPATPPVDVLTSRTLAAGEGWRVGEFVCRAGPGDRPFEERHDSVSISAVVEGTFQYRSADGAATLYPGAFMLGNAGTCFECGHAHGVGDRCIGIQFAPDYFEEIAASAAGTARFRFPAAMIPAIAAMALPAVEAAVRAVAPDPAAAEAWAVGVAERVLCLLAGNRASTAAPSARDERRISAVLRHIEAKAEQPLDLGALAKIACMSKYHFLRTFRRLTGVTPYNFLIGLRMRRAALRLATTRAPVAAIAYDSGFGDLSTFNARFRTMFGAPPGGLRNKRRPA